MNTDADMNLYVLVNSFILIVNIAIFFYQRYEASKLRRIALKDDFWFRTIALPIVLEPLQEFSVDQTRKLRELTTNTPTDTNTYDSYLEKCQSSIHIMMDRCYVMRAHSVSLYDDLIEQLELMEDKVALYCWKKGENEVRPPSLFTRTYTKIISIIMKFHDENKFIK